MCCGTQADLEQPAGEAGLRHDHGIDAGNEAEQRPQRSGRADQQDEQRRELAAADPGREADHQHQRREGAEPGQRRIRLPAADAQQQRQLGGAEVEQVVVDEPRRLAFLAEERIARRQAQPDHLVDHRDLGVVEDRAGEDDRAVDEFRQDRGGRAEREHSAPIHAQSGNAEAVLVGRAARGCRQSA